MQTPAAQNAQKKLQANVSRLEELKKQLEVYQVQKKKIRTDVLDIQKYVVETLLSFGVAWVDVSGNGSGPFWVLTKEKTDGAFNRERYIDFFGHMLPKLTGERLTPVKCYELAVSYLKQFEKRKIVLKKVTQCRKHGGDVEKLRRWLAHGETPDGGS